MIINFDKGYRITRGTDFLEEIRYNENSATYGKVPTDKDGYEEHSMSEESPIINLQILHTQQSRPNI